MTNKSLKKDKNITDISLKNICQKCAPYEIDKIAECKDKSNCLYENKNQWDDKFGLIKKIEGIGKDAPLTTNEKGGKQSKAPMALHLIDPEFLEETFSHMASMCEVEDEEEFTTVDDHIREYYLGYLAMKNIAAYMQDGVDFHLVSAMNYLVDDDNFEQILILGRVLQEGAEKYKPNNWRLIPEEEHLNHAMIHILAWLMGDTQDDHLGHALCRLMMAKATERSKDFQYGAYVE